MLFELEDVQFLSRTAGWVVENDCAQGKAYVDRTGNAGRTWRKAPVRSTNCAAGSRLDISFADAKHGWLLDVYENGSPPYPLERTVDGGATWKPIGRAPIAGRILFQTPRNGWISRSDFAQPQQLYNTVDGGRSWHRRLLPVPPAWKGAHLYPDMPVFFGRRGVLPVTLTRGGRKAVAFYLSSNSGRTWSAASVRQVSSATSRRVFSPFAAYVPTGIANSSTWWLVDSGTDTQIAVTTNAGKTWTVARPTGLPALRGVTISPEDDQHAWLDTLPHDKLVAYTTSDHGRSWQPLPVPTP